MGTNFHEGKIKLSKICITDMPQELLANVWRRTIVCLVCELLKQNITDGNGFLTALMVRSTSQSASLIRSW